MKHECRQRHDQTEHIGKVVTGIGDQCCGMRNPSCGEFCDYKTKIQGNGKHQHPARRRRIGAVMMVVVMAMMRVRAVYTVCAMCTTRWH